MSTSPMSRGLWQMMTTPPQPFVTVRVGLDASNVMAAIDYIRSTCAKGGTMSRTGMSGFDGEELMAVGSVTGVRTWTLTHGSTRMPLLRGINSYGWRPGENVAECTRWRGTFGDDALHQKHAVPDEDCGCGFWAYWALRCGNCWGRALAAESAEWDLGRVRAEELSQLVPVSDFLAGRVPVMTPPPWRDWRPPVPMIRHGGYQCGWRPTSGGEQVHGVVEGYGLTLVGEAGFRAEKAKLRALYLPPPDIQEWGKVGPHMDATRKVINEHLAQAAGLRKRFNVPVYSNVIEMLTEHPTTRDYMPKEDWS